MRDTRPRLGVRWLAMAAGLVGATVGAQTSTAPASHPAATAPAAGATSVPTAPIDPEIDRILTRLEQRTVRDLRAKLTWRQRYLIDDEADAITKTGQIWYQKTDPVGRFLIEFDSQVASGRKDALDERHLFDGCWYTEIQSRTKTVTRREIRRPNDPGDPYKVGEGVFPLPFGQKKADVLREFEVSLLPPAADDPPQSDHVRLTPRPETRSGQTYRELEFWVSREGPLSGLPLRVQVAKKDGTGKLNSFITISFTEVQLNAGFSAGVFEAKTPAGYEEIVERLEPAAAPKP